MKDSLISRVLAVRQDCAYCGEACTYEVYGPHYPTTDHVVPKSRGGTEARGNKTLACLHCNRAKANSIRWPAPRYTLADVLPTERTEERCYEDDDGYDEYGSA